MGIIANVYRTGHSDENGLMRPSDCTMNGWSSLYDRVCVVNAEGPFEPDLNHPAVIVKRHRTMLSLHVVSVDDMESNRWTMFGGNYLACSDSRFGELCRKLLNEEPGGMKHNRFFGIGAISIHDRVE